ncbi:hypothetical protein ACRTEP_23475 [Vibrio diabolicus]|uniref:hypothetical protein n=1 Tax=Vibrio diabolicus TaxID=50719 RepID=UPI00062BFF33|nr:hypothetical protein [Vibrio diabolicus]
MNLVERKKALRFRLMKRFYEVTDGRESKQVTLEQLVDIDSATEQELQDSIDAINYLSKENLIKVAAVLGGGFPAAMFIRHKGVIEVEQALSEPDKKTEHFNPTITITNNIGTMTNSSLQQATIDSSIQANYQLGTDTKEKISELVKQIRSEFEIIKSELSKEQAEDAEAELLTIESQLKASKPKKTILGESFSTLGDITKDVASSGIWTLIQAAIETIA